MMEPQKKFKKNNEAGKFICVKLILLVSVIMFMASVCDNKPPVAVITDGDRTVGARITVSFDGTQSYDPDENVITQYFWTFGDSGSASGDKVTHIYNSPGQYTVTLFVKDRLAIGKTTCTINVVHDSDGDGFSDFDEVRVIFRTNAVDKKTWHDGVGSSPGWYGPNADGRLDYMEGTWIVVHDGAYFPDGTALSYFEFEGLGYQGVYRASWADSVQLGPTLDGLTIELFDVGDAEWHRVKIYQVDYNKAVPGKSYYFSSYVRPHPERADLLSELPMPEFVGRELYYLGTDPNIPNTDNDGIENSSEMRVVFRTNSQSSYITGTWIAIPPLEKVTFKRTTPDGIDVDIYDLWVPDYVNNKVSEGIYAAQDPDVRLISYIYDTTKRFEDVISYGKAEIIGIKTPEGYSIYKDKNDDTLYIRQTLSDPIFDEIVVKYKRSQGGNRDYVLTPRQFERFEEKETYKICWIGYDYDRNKFEWEEWAWLSPMSNDTDNDGIPDSSEIRTVFRTDAVQNPVTGDLEYVPGTKLAFFNFDGGMYCYEWNRVVSSSSIGAVDTKIKTPDGYEVWCLPQKIPGSIYLYIKKENGQYVEYKKAPFKGAEDFSLSTRPSLCYPGSESYMEIVHPTKANTDDDHIQMHSMAEYPPQNYYYTDNLEVRVVFRTNAEDQHTINSTGNYVGECDGYLDYMSETNIAIKICSGPKTFALDQYRYIKQSYCQ